MGFGRGFYAWGLRGGVCVWCLHLLSTMSGDAYACQLHTIVGTCCTDI